MSTLPVYGGQTRYGVTVYPYRMSYDAADKLYNAENAEYAVNTWFGGEDSRWARVWWDVADNE